MRIQTKHWWRVFSKKPLQTPLHTAVIGREHHPSWQQIKLFPSILTQPEIYIIIVLLLIFIASSVILTNRWHWRHTELIPKAGGEYTEGLVGNLRAINPLFASSNEVDASISQLLFNGLFQASGMELINNLAESYTVSSDGKIYTITLKKNLTWSDSEPLTADDVIFTIQAIQDPAIKSSLAGNLQNVQANKIDDHTFSLKLSEPFAPFLTTLTFGILPEHIWQNIQPANFLLAELNTKPVGNGPYQFKALTKDKQGSIRSYTLEPNPNYFGQKPFLKKISFKFYPDYETAIQALQDGNIDGLGSLPCSSKSKINNRRYNLYQLSLPQYAAIFLNPQTNEALKNKTLRQALIIATDRDNLINNILSCQVKKIDGTIPQGALGYTDNIKKYAYDAGWAAELLEQNGWLRKDDGWRYKDENKLSITLTIPDREEYIEVANAIRDNWNNIGVETSLEVIPAFRLQKDIIATRNYQALLASEILGLDPDPYPFWHSSQNQAPGLSLSIFANDNIDKILEQARQAVDPKIRAAKYNDFQSILAEEAYAIFLYSPTYTYVLNKDIQGLGLIEISMPSDRLADISSWYRLTDRSWKK
ncbi:MAG: ABC transporter substrate-binding protein [Patescibacteria group bacterium]